MRERSVRALGTYTVGYRLGQAFSMQIIPIHRKLLPELLPEPTVRPHTRDHVPTVQRGKRRGGSRQLTH